MAPRTAVLTDWVKAHAHALEGKDADFDPVMDQIGDARVVMLGEASHGTSEFYALRARLTERLIQEQGFTLVCIEGDWPDALKVNRYVQGGSGSALEALEGFRRFPTWMWRNTVVMRFVEWLRRFNETVSEAQQVGFYGLDVYSLHTSMAAVIRFLDQVDPQAAQLARKRYGCFAPYGQDTQQYALQAHYLSASCEEEVVATLIDLQRRRGEYARRASEDAAFEAELNALAAIDAERYYRHMIRSDVESWNLRDRHMAVVLDRLLDRVGPGGKAILWEHNTHIGDFRATSEGPEGYLNVGQLVRERYGDQAIAIGYGTYQGTVTAASAWDGPAEFKPVPPARNGSYEAILHQAGIPQFYLGFQDLTPQDTPGGWLFRDQDERAIGVVYEPTMEAYGNYLSARLAERYDGYFFLDETLAIEPLDLGPEPPGLEGYPSGL